MKGINNVLRNNFIGYSFLLLVLGLLSIYFYKDTIYLFPSYIHSWAQSDRYALALGFLDNGFDILHPTTYNLDPTIPGTYPLVDRKGITGVDFPLHEFIVAVIMKITGNNSPIVFRIYSLMYSIIGFFFLFLFVKGETFSYTKSFFVVFFAFTCPVYVFYQAGFLPSITSFSNVLIGLYFFSLYRRRLQIRFIICCTLFFTAAALSRTPFSIILFAALIQQVYLNILHYKLFSKEIIFYLLGIGCVVFASVYKYYLNNHYGTLFLSEIMPIKNIAQLKEVIGYVYRNWLYQYFTFFHYIAMGAVIAISFFLIVTRHLWRSFLRNETYQFAIILLGSGIVYFLLMAWQFPDHDYYFIDTFLLPVIILFVVMIKHITFQSPIFNSMFTILVVLLSVGFVYQANAVQVERYSFHDWDKAEIGKRNFLDSKHFLDSLQISPNASIAVIDAYSVNGPLVLMRRKGYCVRSTNKEEIERVFAFNPDFVVLQDQFIMSDIMKNYPGIINKLNRVGSNGKISVYTINREGKENSLPQFLGIIKTTPLFSSNLNFDTLSTLALWNNIDKRICNSEHSCWAYMDSTLEYGATLHFKAHSINSTSPLHLFFKGSFFSQNTLKDAMIVTSIDLNNKNVYYQTIKLREYISTNDEWKTVQLSFSLPKFKTKEDELKCYLWNPGKENFLYDSLLINIY